MSIIAIVVSMIGILMSNKNTAHLRVMTNDLMRYYIVGSVAQVGGVILVIQELDKPIS